MAASYQCSGSVKNRSFCTKEQIVSIQREQFKELPRLEALQYQEIMRQVDKSFAGDDTEEDAKQREINSAKPLGNQVRYKHTVYDFQSILCQEHLPNKDGTFEMWALSSRILDEYIWELVRYANDRRHTADKREEVQKSCVMFTGDEFDAWGHLPHMTLKRVADDFQARDLEGEKFMNLDYVLIPYWRDTSHHILLGMAPKQKFIFAIDSRGRSGGYSLDDELVSILLSAALTMIDPEVETEDWPIYCQWARREPEKSDGSPNVPRQGDYWNCGFFTATNAMCLAFGYDLLCYRQRDLENGPHNDLDPPRGKRARMAAELYQGLNFDPPFNYDLLAIPTKRPAKTPRGPNVPGHESEQVQLPVEMEGVEQGVFEPGFKTATDWPVQFSSKYFWRAGFIYKPNEVESDYWNPLQTTWDLVQACKSRNMLGYEDWAEKGVKLFKRWAINYCTAIRKIHENDPLQPMEGLSRPVDLDVDYWAREMTPEIYDDSGDEGTSEIYDDPGDEGTSEIYDDSGDEGTSEIYDDSGDEGTSEIYDGSEDDQLQTMEGRGRPVDLTVDH